MHAIEREGLPPAVVLFTDIATAAYWEPTLERLAQFGARGIAVDLPGFADSANIPGPYTMEGLADALARFLDGLKLASVVMVGDSMGGVVAQDFARRRGTAERTAGPSPSGPSCPAALGVIRLPH